MDIRACGTKFVCAKCGGRLHNNRKQPNKMFGNNFKCTYSHSYTHMVCELAHRFIIFLLYVNTSTTQMHIHARYVHKSIVNILGIYIAKVGASLLCKGTSHCLYILVSVDFNTNEIFFMWFQILFLSQLICICFWYLNKNPCQA